MILLRNELPVKLVFQIALLCETFLNVCQSLAQLHVPFTLCRERLTIGCSILILFNTLADRVELLLQCCHLVCSRPRDLLNYDYLITLLVNCLLITLPNFFLAIHLVSCCCA